jgi:hypothetical protein
MALVGLHDPPIKIGGFKMIDVLIAQVGFMSCAVESVSKPKAEIAELTDFKL